MAEARALDVLKPKRETLYIGKVSGEMLKPKTVAVADKSTFIVSRIVFPSLTKLFAWLFS